MTFDMQTPLGLPPERDPFYKAKQRKNLARIGYALTAYLLLGSFVQEALSIAVEWLAPAFYESVAFDWILNILPAYGIALPFFRLFLMGMPKKAPEKKPLTKENALAFLCIAFSLTMMGNFISTSLIRLFEALRGQEIGSVLNSYIENSSPLMIFITVVVLAPIFEELMFRKWIIDRLLPYSECLAVVTSGLFFGLIHGNFYQFFYACMLGMLLGLIYVKTGKLRYTILLHGILNFTGSTIASFLAEVTSEGVMLESSINPWVTVSGVYSAALLLMVFCGFFFLLRKRKEFTLSKIGDHYLTLGTQFKLAWGNIGILAFGILCILMFILSLFI